MDHNDAIKGKSGGCPRLGLFARLDSVRIWILGAGNEIS
jgi:hypothetical protein